VGVGSPISGSPCALRAVLGCQPFSPPIWDSPAIKPERQAPPATSFGEEVHSDVWGPSPDNSIGGKRYYITFTDNYSHYTWARTLKAKSEAFEAYKEFAAWARMQHSATIHRFRSDQGGKYMSNNLKAFL
jgi:hypothetical protein